VAFIMKSPSYTPDNPQKSVKQLYSWAYQLNEYLKYMFSHLDEDSFSSDFYKAVASGKSEQVQALEEKVAILEKAFETEGKWQTLTFVNASAWPGDLSPRIIRIMNTVYITGAVNTKTSLSAGVSMTICKLPEEYRPKHQLAFTVPFSTGAVRMDIYTSGVMEIKNNSGSTIASGRLVSVSVSYTI